MEKACQCADTSIAVALQCTSINKNDLHVVDFFNLPGEMPYTRGEPPRGYHYDHRRSHQRGHTDLLGEVGEPDGRSVLALKEPPREVKMHSFGNEIDLAPARRVLCAQAELDGTKTQVCREADSKQLEGDAFGVSLFRLEVFVDRREWCIEPTPKIRRDPPFFILRQR